MFLQFPMVAMGSALRGMGDMKIPTMIQIGTLADLLPEQVRDLRKDWNLRPALRRSGPEGQRTHGMGVRPRRYSSANWSITVSRKRLSWSKT